MEVGKLFSKGQIVRILDVAGQEANSRLLCRYLFNHLKCNHLIMHKGIPSKVY